MIEVHIEKLDVGSAWGVEDPDSGRAEIKWLFVGFEFQGQGDGAQLLQRLESRLAHHGAKTIQAVADVIDTSSENANSLSDLIAWYERRCHTHLGAGRICKLLWK